MVTKLEKVVSLAAKHKAALNKLNASLGPYIVRHWERMYADYFNGVAVVNISQDTDDGASILFE